MATVVCDGFEFDFPDAHNAFVFDDKDKTSRNFHGLSHAMKAVDIIVELEDYYLFVEVKDFHDPERYRKKEPFNYLREVLKYKFRDTWLYRWAEGKIDKPVKYWCLLELETPLLTRMNKELHKQLPMKACGPRWRSEICNGRAVLNAKLWNNRKEGWTVRRVGNQI